MKAFFISVLLILSFTTFGYCNWITKAGFAGGARFRAVSLTIGNKGYVGLGNTSTVIFGDWWEYDSISDSWTQKADFPPGARSAACGFAIGNLGYIGTGWDGVTGQYMNDLWEYNPSTDTWSQKSNIGTIGRIGATAFSIGSNGYLGTGEADLMSNYYLSDFWKYNSDSDTWNQLADFAGTPRSFATSFSLHGIGYLTCGADQSVLSSNNELWSYDTLLDSWNQLPSLPSFERYSAVGWSSANSLLIGSGRNDFFSLNLNDFWKYNPDSNLWIQLDTFPTEGIERACGFNIGNSLFFLTGINSNIVAIDSVWELLPDSLNSILSLNYYEADFIVYPNPTYGTLHYLLTNSNQRSEDILITVSTISGKQLKIIEKHNSGQDNIDLSDLVSGIYIIKFQSKTKVAFKKILII